MTTNNTSDFASAGVLGAERHDYDLFARLRGRQNVEEGLRRSTAYLDAAELDEIMDVVAAFRSEAFGLCDYLQVVAAQAEQRGQEETQKVARRIEKLLRWAYFAEDPR